MPPHQVVPVANAQQLEQMVVTYVTQGYKPAVRTETSAVLIKNKELNWVWVIVGFFICMIPMIIELVRYYRADNLVVEIRLVAEDQVEQPNFGAEPDELQGKEPHLSKDGTQWWDGTRWHRVTA